MGGWMGWVGGWVWVAFVQTVLTMQKKVGWFCVTSLVWLEFGVVACGNIGLL